jgi:eukaryotic-like serine/threonine-protein kinase
MDLQQELEASLGNTYSLERELGGGGMSRVFVADERRLKRKVVIKLLSGEMAAGVSSDRFEREIQLAASLQQANIVPILAAGEAQGMPYYTMPFVEGESLRARIQREGQLPIGSVVSILRDVSKALAYAHQHGVVHRDIKPDNVLLSGGTAVVTDFGIAKAISASRTDSAGATLTQMGTSIGTPAYMSPEQAAGDPSVDLRSDIYSFGCMAFELLAGEVPFAGRTPARMLAAHISEPPPSLAQLRPETPAPLEQLVMQCLAKEPGARPQSAAEILGVLDAMSGTTTMMSAATGAPRDLRRTLTMYGAALVAVAILARASVVALGLPDWVFTGALIIALLGLPLVLFSWFVERTARRLAVRTPQTSTATPPGTGTLTNLAVKAGPHFTWRRAWMTGAAALGGFAVLVAVYMILRALGIGPEGSLLAAGKLSDRGRLIVTTFAAPDSSIGTLVTEAVRTNLSQSKAVLIMSPVSIAGALQRMQRPPSSRLDLDLAREVAQREGATAVVDGAVTALGTGYAVSIRLVSADSANELAAYQETADSPRDLLRAIDELTRKLRGRIGESLREVRASPPLEKVTTPSLEALRIYAEAARFIDMGGNPLEGAERLREAVRIDTGFAMAWRKLGVALNNINMPRVRVDSALENAYRFRDRLTERERLLTEGTYFQLGPGRDRRRAIRAYEALLKIDSTESGAANNLGTALSSRREFARAESVYKTQMATGRATSQQYTNLVQLLFNGGKEEESERMLGELQQRYPTSLFAQTAPLSFLYYRGQLDSMESSLKRMTADRSDILKLSGLGGLTNLSLLRGRMGDLLRYASQAQRLQQTLGQGSNAIGDSLQLAFLDLVILDDTAKAVRRMDATLAKHDLRAMPVEQRPYGGLAAFYASAGQLRKAQTLLAQRDADMTDSVMRRVRQPERHAMLAYIARAERRYQDAIRELWRSDTTYDGPDGTCGVCILDDVASTWNDAGVTDSAIYYYEKFLNTPFFGRQGLDAVPKPLILKRLGELYESKGDVANAARYYRDFIKLWEKADPPLQEKVADAKYRLSRLANVEKRQP